jgi:5-methylcytosine-specific restriction endonuclease McrA
MITYREKLRDARWQKKRLNILQRDNWKCVECQSEEKNLQVYHILYLKIDPWDYADDLLQTLCDDCHAQRQGIVDSLVNALRIRLKKIPTKRLAVICRRVMADAMEEISLS